MPLLSRKRNYIQVPTTDSENVGDTTTHDFKKKTSNAGSSATADDAPSLGTSVIMGRLLELSRPERKLMIYGALAMTFSSAVSLAVPGYSGKIIDLALADDADEDASRTLLTRLLCVMTLSGVAGFFRIFCQAQAGQRLVARLRRKLYASILSQDTAYFDSINQGDIISRLTSDSMLINGAVTDQALGLMRSIVVAIGAVIMLFNTSVTLAMISVATLPPMAVCAKLMGRRMRDRQKKVQELRAAATSLAEQALTCIRTVQQFVAENWESQQYNKAINQAHGEAIKNVKLKALFQSAMQLVVNLLLLCVLGFGGTLVKRGALSPGDLASFVMYSVMLGSNASGISSEYVDLMKAVAAANRVFEVMDREPAIPPPDIAELPENEVLLTADDQTEAETADLSTTESNLDGTTDEEDALELSEVGGVSSTLGFFSDRAAVAPKSVKFVNTTFSYPSRPEAKVLKALNLSVTAGRSVALVGGSGAGKSTIASLLTRLYDPQGGDIQIDDISLRDMKPGEVRRFIGIVSQEPLLFPTTIEANIRYGSPIATDAEVREAARLAFVLEFADKFPDGLKTIVGPRGTQLSGGQKQRVAVARCILKNPPIVIFDEATSALDAHAETQVQKAIDTACKGRTVIIVAHRLSTVRNADAIAVLNQGCIVELGSFENLMSREGGAFRTLMHKQLVQT